MTSPYRELKERAWAANQEIPKRGLAIYTFGYPEGRAPFRVAVGEVGNLPARFDAGWTS